MAAKRGSPVDGSLCDCLANAAVRRTEGDWNERGIGRTEVVGLCKGGKWAAWGGERIDDKRGCEAGQWSWARLHGVAWQRSWVGLQSAAQRSLAFGLLCRAVEHPG